jgi:type II restriction enzyme
LARRREDLDRLRAEAAPPGLALGYDVWIASNDGDRSDASGKLSHGCLPDRLRSPKARPRRCG